MSTFRPFPVASVTFDDSVRQRRSVGNIDELANSIAAVGLINPIVLTRDGELVAGRRRLEAVKALGWSSIPVQFRDELSELERERIEFDENAHRLDLTWQERTLAIHRFHELSQRLEGADWTQARTAETMGFSKMFVKNHLRVARAILEADPVVLEAPLFSTALGILERRDSRRQDSNLSNLDQIIKGNGKVPVEEAAYIPAPEEDEPGPILNADFLEWAKTYEGPKFNLLHCDFPYGINAGEHDQGAGKSHGSYVDDEELYWELITALQNNMDRLVADSAHMLFWFSMKHYDTTESHLLSIGWQVNPHPMIWWRSDNSGILPDPRRMPRQVYETAFLCARGDRQLVRAKSNLIASPNTKRWHMSEKPVPVLEHFMSMLVDDTTILLDPTCGSGNALVVGQRLGARHCLGVEQSKEFYTNAQANWRESFTSGTD